MELGTLDPDLYYVRMSVVLRLLVAIAVALLLLGLWLSLLGGDLVAGFAEGARRLFLFTDIALVVWLVLLVVGAVRRWASGHVVLTALVAAVLNLLTVIVVGFVQGGAAPWAFMLFAVEGGVAFVAGAVISALVVKGPRRVAPPT